LGVGDGDEVEPWVFDVVFDCFSYDYFDVVGDFVGVGMVSYECCFVGLWVVCSCFFGWFSTGGICRCVG